MHQSVKLADAIYNMTFSAGNLFLFHLGSSDVDRYILYTIWYFKTYFCMFCLLIIFHIDIFLNDLIFINPFL